MQASKIVIGRTYAIRTESGELARFHVSEVVTRRVSNHGNPHDYKSHVIGFIRDDAPDVVEKNDQITVSPEKVLGPYEDYIELVERANAEKAAKQKVIDAHTALVEEVWRLLYAATDTPLPNDPQGYKNSFRINYNRTIEISAEALPLMLEFLRAKERADA